MFFTPKDTAGSFHWLARVRVYARFDIVPRFPHLPDCSFSRAVAYFLFILSNVVSRLCKHINQAYEIGSFE